jgi:hypothetical protein
MRSADKLRLFKRVEIKVIFPPKTFPSKRFIFRAPSDKGFNATGIYGLQDQVAEGLESKFPMWDFRLVPLAANGNRCAFNYVYDSIKASYVEQLTKESNEHGKEINEAIKQADFTLPGSDGDAGTTNA